MRALAFVAVAVTVLVLGGASVSSLSAAIPSGHLPSGWRLVLLPGGKGSAAAISSNGDIVGRIDRGRHSRAALWHNRQLISLPIPSGYTDSEASSINDSGMIVGSVYVQPPSGLVRVSRAVVWKGKRVTLLQGHWGSAFAVNSSGEIVGGDGSSVGSTDYRTVVWENATSKSVPAFTSFAGSGIVDDGTVYGIDKSGSLEYEAAWKDGALRRLPGQGQGHGVGVAMLAVAGNGILVGTFNANPGGRDFLFRAGRYTWLPRLFGAQSVNNRGVVVGSFGAFDINSTPNDFSHVRPAVWHAGKLVKLSGIGGSGIAVNDSDEVAGELLVNPRNADDGTRSVAWLPR